RPRPRERRLRERPPPLPPLLSPLLSPTERWPPLSEPSPAPEFWAVCWPPSLKTVAASALLTRALSERSRCCSAPAFPASDCAAVSALGGAAFRVTLRPENDFQSYYPFKPLHPAGLVPADQVRLGLLPKLVGAAHQRPCHAASTPPSPSSLPRAVPGPAPAEPGSRRSAERLPSRPGHRHRAERAACPQPGDR